MRIAQLAPLAESGPSEALRRRGVVIAWLLDEAVREVARLDRRKLRAFEERFVASRMAREEEAQYCKLIARAEKVAKAQRT